VKGRNQTASLSVKGRNQTASLSVKGRNQKLPPLAKGRKGTGSLPLQRGEKELAPSPCEGEKRNWLPPLLVKGNQKLPPFVKGNQKLPPLVKGRVGEGFGYVLWMM